MQTVIIIPARYASKRFPGKPLAMIAGCSLLKRVWSLAKAVENVDEVYVATDDQRIFEHAESFGAKVLQTPETCRNGTERVHAALQSFTQKPRIVINFQGDAVLTPPWVLQSLVVTMNKKNPPPIATPAAQLSWEQYHALLKAKKNGETSGTLVTFGRDFNALYFSKSLIPNLRTTDQDRPPVFKHIGIYAYTYEALENYLSLKPTLFEQAESLEQLRALENGIPIKTVLVDFKNRTPWSIDCPADVQRAEAIISDEGELTDL